MAGIFLILKAAPEQEQQAHFIWNLAQAAEAQGHKVTVHVYGDAVYNLANGLGGAKKDLGPVGTDEVAGKENINFMYCNFNAMQRGVDKQLLASARSASTTDAAFEMLKHDRVLIITA